MMNYSFTSWRGGISQIIVMTKLRVARQGNGVRFSAGTKDLSLLHSVKTGSGVHTASFSVCSRVPSSGVEKLEHRTDRPLIIQCRDEE
jgi:hypothetical protein